MKEEAEFLAHFCKNYSKQDYDGIQFKWNGKKRNDFEDNNAVFRKTLCDFILQDLSVANDALILDLYMEYSIIAKNLFGINRVEYTLIAQEVLNRNHTSYLLHYLEGAVQCFDTLLSSANISLTEKQKEEIVLFIQKKLNGFPTKKEKHLLQLGLDRFGK